MLGPYAVGMVRLEEGPLVTAQLTDVDEADLHIGMEVEMVTRKIQELDDHGFIVYGYKFRPVLRPRVELGVGKNSAAEEVPAQKAVAPREDVASREDVPSREDAPSREDVPSRKEVPVHAERQTVRVSD